MSYDSYFSSVVLLLKGEGANDSNLIKDTSRYSRKVSSVGAARVKTDEFHDGASSIYLDGVTSSSYLAVGTTTDLDVGSGDFTFECWINRQAITDGSYADNVLAATNDLQGFTVCITPGGRLAFNVSSTGSSWNVRRGSDPGDPVGITVIPLNTWTHIALVRNGSTWYGFVNGAIDQTFISSATVSASTGGWRVGRGGSSLTRYFKGHIDNLRFTKGVARYTTTFDPTLLSYDSYGLDVTVPSIAEVDAYGGAYASITAPPVNSYSGVLRVATVEVPAPKPTVQSGSGAAFFTTAPTPTVSSAVHSSYGGNALIFTAPSFSLSSFGGGNAAAALPMPTVSFTATGTALANVDVVAPAATVQSTGTVSAVAQVDAAVPMATLIGYGGAVCSVTAPGMPAVEVTGTAGGVASAAVTLPMFDVVASGTAQNYGSLIAAAPMPGMLTGLQAYVLAPMATLVASGTATVAATYEAYTMNMKHAPRPRGQEDTAPVNEVTRYTNFPFTHIVRHKNSYYGVNSSGLYLLEGTTDNGTAIPYEARTHISDLDEIKLKTVVSAYFGGRLGAASTVTLYAGESTVEAYAFTTPRGAVAQNYRQKFGRGLKTRYFALGASGSAEFSIDNVAFEVATMTRRV